MRRRLLEEQFHPLLLPEWNNSCRPTITTRVHQPSANAKQQKLCQEKSPLPTYGYCRHADDLITAKTKADIVAIPVLQELS